MAKTDAELKARSAEADIIIADLKAKIEKIKSMGPLPANIQETILKQENAILRKLSINQFLLDNKIIHF